MKLITNKEYKVGRSNLAVTIFVPYDCPNKCVFCTSKDDYGDTSNFSLTDILISIQNVCKLKQVRDIVVTGGEPFADLEQLQAILDTCYPFMKNVYINTTLPCKSEEEGHKLLEFIEKNYSEHKINGLNISRHMLIKTNYEDDRLIAIMHTKYPRLKLRINSVLLGVNAEEDNVNSFIAKYSPIVNSINFRGDYTKIKDQNDLRGLDHPVLDILFTNRELDYLGSGGCLVCNNNDFYHKDSKTYVSLHRGYEHSMVVKNYNYILNDIIIKQDGSILADWDGERLELELISNQWCR